jgi:hypothetical protein
MNPNQKLLVIFGLLFLVVCIIFLRGAPAQKDLTPEVFSASKSLTEITAVSNLSAFLTLEIAINDVIKTHGIEAGFDLIDEAEKQEFINNDQCHSLLHYVGHAAYSATPNDFEAMTYIAKGSSCIGGYIHGIEAEILLSSENIIEDTKSFCYYTKKVEITPGACYHGTGHAAAEGYQYNIEKALSLCDSLEDGPETDLGNCYRGVFSEVGNVVMGVDGHTGLEQEKIAMQGLDEKNPYAFCELFDERHQSSCISQLTKLVFKDRTLEESLMFCVNPDFSKSTQEICTSITTGSSVRNELSFQETVVLPHKLFDLEKNIRETAILGSLEAFSGYRSDGVDKDWGLFCSQFPSVSDKEFCLDVFSRTYNMGEAPWMDRALR